MNSIAKINNNAKTVVPPLKTLRNVKHDNATVDSNATHNTPFFKYDLTTVGTCHLYARL